MLAWDDPLLSSYVRHYQLIFITLGFVLSHNNSQEMEGFKNFKLSEYDFVKSVFSGIIDKIHIIFY